MDGGERSGRGMDQNQLIICPDRHPPQHVVPVVYGSEPVYSYVYLQHQQSQNCVPVSTEWYPPYYPSVFPNVTVQGTPANAYVQSNPGNACVQSNPGNACVQSNPGNACVHSNPGNAYVQSNPGNAYVQSNPGNAYVQTAPGNATVQSNLGNAYAQTAPGNAYVRTAPANADVQGGAANADVQGGAANANVQGGAANANVQGGAANAYAQGGAANAYAQGGAANANAQGSAANAYAQGRYILPTSQLPQNLEPHMESLSLDLDEVCERIRNLESSMNAQMLKGHSSIGELPKLWTASSSQSNRRRVDTRTLWDSKMGDRIGSLEQMNNLMQGIVSSLETDVGHLRGQIGELESAMNHLQHEIGTLLSENVQLKARNQVQQETDRLPSEIVQPRELEIELERDQPLRATDRLRCENVQLRDEIDTSKSEIQTGPVYYSSREDTLTHEVEPSLTGQPTRDSRGESHIAVDALSSVSSSRRAEYDPSRTENLSFKEEDLNEENQIQTTGHSTAAGRHQANEAMIRALWFFVPSEMRENMTSLSGYGMQHYSSSSEMKAELIDMSSVLGEGIGAEGALCPWSMVPTESDRVPEQDNQEKEHQVPAGNSMTANDYPQASDEQLPSNSATSCPIPDTEGDGDKAVDSIISQPD